VLIVRAVRPRRHRPRTACRNILGMCAATYLCCNAAGAVMAAGCQICKTATAVRVRLLLYSVSLAFRPSCGNQCSVCSETKADTWAEEALSCTYQRALQVQYEQLQPVHTPVLMSCAVCSQKQNCAVKSAKRQITHFITVMSDGLSRRQAHSFLSFTADHSCLKHKPTVAS